MSKDFVHLHVHSHNSILDGMSTQEEIAKTIASHNSPAFAVTDHGYTAGLVSAYQAAQKYDLKFIPGLETYLCRDNTKKPTAKPRGDKAHTSKNENETTHLLLLAKSQRGLYNLHKLSSEGATTGAFGANAKRVTNEHLERYGEGLIATSGCLASRVSQHLLRGEYERACEEAAVHQDIFGKGNYFIEVQNHGIADQLKIIPDQIRLSKEMGIPLVATNDSHYTEQGDCVPHDHYLAMQTGKATTTMQEGRFKFDGDEHYIKPPAEMHEIFPEDEFPGACDNTMLIAEMVEDIHISNNELLIPEFEYEKFGYDSVDDMLRDQSLRGLDKLLDGNIPDSYLERLDFELEIIRNMKIQSYFLIVAAILEFCRDNGIQYGPGRGSAAGSLVVHSLGITKVDPIEHGLIFSRFLNAGRTDSMPDIDVDIDPKRHHEVVDYMADRWGRDRVVNIEAFQTFKAKSAIANSAAVHDYIGSDGQVHNSKRFGQEAKTFVEGTSDLSAMVLEERPEDEALAKEWDSGAALRKFATEHKEQEMDKVIQIASRVAGRNRGNGIHPAGVLITPGPADEFFPIRKGREKGDLNVCQFNCSEVDMLNGLKMDLLRLNNLTTIGLAVKNIERDCGEIIDIDKIPLDDPKVYEMLRRGDALGVFQVESGGMRDTMRSIQPTSFDDISALIALFRPGPMEMNSHVRYAKRKNNQEEVEYFHEDAKDILEDTFGLVVYQEQVMAISQRFANYSEKEADDFRRAMGKKKKSVMEAMHEDFVQRVADNGYTRELGIEIWNTVEPFAGYAFNKAHSVSYGYIVYQTAWLKANYYPQYIAALIDTTKKKSEQMIPEAISKNYIVEAPDVNRSLYHSTTTSDTIGVGFNNIAGFGADFHNGDAVVRERKNHGQYKSVVDFIARNPKVRVDGLINLIKSGAFDNLPDHNDRDMMINQAKEIIESGKKAVQEKKRQNQFAGSFLGESNEVSIDDMANFDFSSPTDVQRKRVLEREALGFFVGQHPYSDFEPEIASLRANVPAMRRAVSVKEAREQHIVGYAQVFGALLEYKERSSKAGREMTSFVVDCGDSNTMEGMVMGHGHFAEDDLLGLVLIDGRVEEDTFNTSMNEETGEEEEIVELRFGFGAKVAVIKRSADSSVTSDAMAIAESKSTRKSDKKSGSRAVTTKRNTKRKKEEKSESTVSHAETFARQQKAKHARKRAQAHAKDFCVRLDADKQSVESNVLIQHIVACIHRHSEEEGHKMFISVGSESVDTDLRVPAISIPKLRREIKKLAQLSGITVKVTQNN